MPSHFSRAEWLAYMANPGDIGWKGKWSGCRVYNNNIYDKHDRIVVPYEDIGAQLQQIYEDPETGLMGRDKMYEKVKHAYAGIWKSDVEKFLKGNTTHQLFRMPRTEKVTRPIVSTAPYKVWQIDLIDMSKLAGVNNGINYLLTCIDIFSKYAWVEPVRAKTEEQTRDALKHILETAPQVPSTLQSDRGAEFKNKSMNDLLTNDGIKHIYGAAYTPKTQGVIERFNGTLKRMIAKFLHVRGSNQYIDALGAIVENYNNTKHTTTKQKPVDLIEMAPGDVKDAKKEIVAAATASRQASIQPFVRIRVGDRVRLHMNVYPEIRKQRFRKSYEQQYSAEVFEVYKITEHRKAYTSRSYYVQDVNGQKMSNRLPRDKLLLVPRTTPLGITQTAFETTEPSGDPDDEDEKRNDSAPAPAAPTVADLPPPPPAEANQTRRVQLPQQPIEVTTQQEERKTAPRRNARKPARYND